MGKLLILSGKQVCAILMQHGFIEVRQRGSHIVMQKRFPDTTITVLAPNDTDLRVGTVQSMIGQSGLPRTDFEAEKQNPVNLGDTIG